MTDKNHCLIGHFSLGEFSERHSHLLEQIFYFCYNASEKLACKGF